MELHLLKKILKNNPFKLTTFFILIGLILLSFGIQYSFNFQYEKNIKQLKSEAIFIAEIVKLNLEKNNYLTVKKILMKWNKKFKESIVKIELNFNKNILPIEIVNKSHAKHTYNFNTTINYPSGQANLNIIFDMKSFYNEMYTETIILLSATFFFIFLLLFFIYFYFKLKKTEYQANTYLNVASVILIATDKNLNITLVNKKALEIFEYKPEEMIGKNFVELLISDEEKERVRNCLISLIKKNSFEHDVNYVITKSGKKRLIEWHNQVLKDTSDKISGIISSGQDITDKKVLEEQMLQAQKMESIGRLVGGIAHDFNNILSGIIGNLELALNHTNDSKLVKFISSAYDSAENASNLVKQLLSYGRKQKVKAEIINLNEELKKTCNTLKNLIGEDIKFELILNGNPKIKTDKTQLEQIIYNLIINARDAVNQKKKLTHKKIILKTDIVNINNFFDLSPGEYVIISVIDNGIGMDKEIIDKIFEPFFTTKEIGKGTGLGLSSVYGIVKQNNAHINVESEKDKGTKFSIYWPLYKKEVKQEDIYQKEEININNLRGKESILIIEDDENLANILKEALKKLGYKVQIAKNGVEGLEKLKKNPKGFDIIITDIIMPEMNGKEFAENALKINKNLKIIFISGYSQETLNLNKFMKYSMEFIQKPFSPIYLARKVREMI